MDDTTDPAEVEVIRQLYAERVGIESFLNSVTPKPPPPPPDPQNWVGRAKERQREIDAILTEYFYPDRKAEGMQRTSKDGFEVMYNPSIARTVDPAVLAQVLQRCPAGTEDKYIVWKPSLNLDAYRKMPAKVRAIFDECITAKDKPAEFEIVEVEAYEEE